MEQLWAEDLFDLAWISDVDDRLGELMEKVEKEDWSYHHTEREHPFPILYNHPMIDWNAVLATLPNRFTLDTIITHETASEKSRAYLRQVVVCWSKEGRIKSTGRGAYQKT